MVVNGEALLRFKPIKGMIKHKVTNGLVSHGLAECGYDIRIAQSVLFNPARYHISGPLIARASCSVEGDVAPRDGLFALASAIEEFDMPPQLMGVVHDKSTWARQGLSVFNTIIEPGWRGFLTLELVFHGRERLHIPAGSGIAQVIFHETILPANYVGKYQDQADGPVPSKFA